jgi:hypothetical protein
MSRSWKVAAATVLIIIGVGGAVKAIDFLGTEGLDRAEKWISIAGMVVSTGIGIGGLLLGWASLRVGTPAPAQRIEGSTVGGDVVQARGVRGGLRIGPPTVAHHVPADSGPIAVSSDWGQRPLGQSVSGTHAAGSMHQIDDIGGDVEIER